MSHKLAGSLASSASAIVSLQRTCPGVNVTHSQQLRSLRFCTYIAGSLTLSVSNPDAKASDFYVFDALEEIRGYSVSIWSL
jgi:hypothetical protein